MSISISWFQVWDLVEDEMGNFGLELALWWILGFSLSWKWELTSCDAGLTYCVIAPKIATVSLSKVSCIVDKSSSFVSMEHTISFNCCKFLLVSTTFWKKKKNLKPWIYFRIGDPKLNENFRQVGWWRKFQQRSFGRILVLIPNWRRINWGICLYVLVVGLGLGAFVNLWFKCWRKVMGVVVRIKRWFDELFDDNLVERTYVGF